MKYFVYSALAAVSAAQNDQLYTAANFPTATFDSVSSDASINELVRTNSDGSKLAIMTANFITTCNNCSFENDSIVQNWMMWEDVDNAGKYDGVTCNVAWNKGRSSGSPAVYNYDNFDYLGYLGSTWTSGAETDPAKNWWLPVNNDRETAYRTTYSKKGSSSQACAAYTPLYKANPDGTPGESDALTERYWKLKNGGGRTISYGWKIWDGDNMYKSMNVPVELTYNWQELGFTDPNPPVETADETSTVEDTNTDTTATASTGSGAAALMTAAATMIATALLI